MRVASTERLSPPPAHGRRPAPSPARGSWRRCAVGRLFGFALAIIGAVPADAADRQMFQSLLDEADRLARSEPWRESQAVLDQLKPHLDQADHSEYARFRLLEARNLALSGQHDEALSMLDDLLAGTMSARQRLEALTAGANIAHDGRRFRKSFTYLDQALKLIEDEQLRDSASRTYSVGAWVMAHVGELQRAEELGRIAVRIATTSDRADEICVARHRLGSVLKERGELHEARTQIESALSACREADDLLFTAHAEAQLGDLLRLQGDGDRAAELFGSAVYELERAGDRSSLAEVTVEYAVVEHERGNSDRVVELLEPILDDVRDVGKWACLADAHQMLAESAQLAGNYSVALAHFADAMRARQKQMRRINNRQVAFLQVQFEMRHTQHQLELAREQQLLRRLEESDRVRQDRFRGAIFLAIVLLVGVLAILLARAVRDRRRFQSLSQRDALTALSNHTRFFELAERTLGLSRQKGIPFTLVLGDIDHFKRVNDQFGHQTGDEVLRRVASRMREHFQHHGIIGRIGGEEFGIALPGMEMDQVEERLLRFRRSLADARHDDPSIRVTMSFGAACPRDGETLEEIRERADSALYEAKRQGRDRIVCCEP